MVLECPEIEILLLLATSVALPALRWNGCLMACGVGCHVGFLALCVDPVEADHGSSEHLLNQKPQLPCRASRTENQGSCAEG